MIILCFPRAFERHTLPAHTKGSKEKSSFDGLSWLGADGVLGRVLDAVWLTRLRPAPYNSSSSHLSRLTRASSQLSARGNALVPIVIELTRCFLD